MEMDNAGERIRRVKQKEDRRRNTDGDTRRRVTKYDGKFSDYADIRSSAGVVIPEVRRVLLDRHRADKEKTAHRTNIIYPSEMARSEWCPRATYYRMSGRSEPASSSSFTLENVFAEGNRIHSKWQNWLADTGLLWGDWRCSRCAELVRNSGKPNGFEYGPCVGVTWVALDERIRRPADDRDYEHDWKYKEVTLASTHYKISGHADGALIKHNCLIEIKSMGVGTLKFEAPKLVQEHLIEEWAVGQGFTGKKVLDIDGLWKDFHRPLLSHVKQGNIYLYMAREMKLPFDSIVFLYEFKANQKVKEFRVQLSEDILEPLLTMAASVEYHLSKGTPPNCPFGGCGQCRAYEKEGNAVNSNNLPVPEVREQKGKLGLD